MCSKSANSEFGFFAFPYNSGEGWNEMEVFMKFPSSYNHRLVFQYFPFLLSTQMGSQNLFMNKSVSTLVPFSLVAFLKNRWLGFWNTCSKWTCLHSPNNWEGAHFIGFYFVYLRKRETIYLTDYFILILYKLLSPISVKPAHFSWNWNLDSKPDRISGVSWQSAMPEDKHNKTAKIY